MFYKYYRIQYKYLSGILLSFSAPTKLKKYLKYTIKVETFALYKFAGSSHRTLSNNEKSNEKVTFP